MGRYFSTTGLFLAAAALASVSCATVDTYLRKGDANFKAGRYRDAVLDYRKALQKSPRSGEAFYGLALSDIQLERFDEAYQSLTKAHEYLPKRVDVMATMADIAMTAYQRDIRNTSLYSTLVQLSTEILAVEPESYDGLRLKGDLALLDKKPQEAVEFFRRANAVRPIQEYLVVGYFQALAETGQGAEAERLAYQLIDRKPNFQPIYDLLLEYYVSVGNYTGGEELLKKRIKNNPGDSSAYTQLAALYKKMNNPAAARSVIDNLQQGYKEHKDAFSAAGDYYAQSGDLAEASAIYEKGLQAQPDQASTFIKRLAAIQIAQGHQAEAFNLLDKVLAKTPDDGEASLLKADMLLSRGEAGDVDKAIAAYQVALKTRPRDGRVLLGLGKAYFSKNDFVSARKVLASASQSDPQNNEPKFLLAAVGMSELLPQGALAILEDILENDPTNPRARYLKINAQMQAGLYAEARPELDRLARDFPKSKDLQLLRGLLAILSSRYEDAEAIFAKFSAVDGDARVAAGLAEAFVGKKQFDKALEVLESASKKSPENLEIRLMIAKTELRAGLYDRAINELLSLLQRAPDSTTMMIDLGQAYQAKGDYGKAAEQFQKAIQPGTKDATPNFFLGFSLGASGKNREAIASYRKALLLRPDDSLILNNLAYALAEVGTKPELDEALRMAQRALEISPGEPDLNDTLGWVWLKKGNVDSALTIFTENCDKFPKNPSYRHHLGLAQLAKGDTPSARKNLEAALANGPSSTEAAEITGALNQLPKSRL
jgi:tetratricopeptide (TPR) repeat protein